MDEQSIFLQALEQPAGEGRDKWLDDACGGDSALRARIDALLACNAQAGDFLESPPSAFEATVIDQAARDVVASLEAGLAPTFSEETAVVIGGASVLRSIGNSLSEIPSVSLRESDAEGNEPIARPHSAEMPQSNSDSRYQLQGEIARGGMGAIIKGRDTDLGRDLAIKVLLDSHKGKPEVIQRFIEEAQIGGQLQHPGIAPIYELGQFSDKRPFFSMKLVKGETLAKLLARRKAPTEDRGRLLGIFEQICQTVAYAHSRGVIHRDLKPANIMVGSFGEVQVMDWGLAKVLSIGGIADEKEAHDTQLEKSIIQTLRSQPSSDVPKTFGTLGSQTQMGSVMGTPAYMPPEQALGEIDNLDERADVFGLGAILCEILTGKPPYVADDGTQVYRLASRGKLADCFARLDESGADHELVALTKQCLELEPVDRPRDAGVLAERISDYLESVETKLRQSEIELAAEAARAEEALHTAREQEAAARAERRARKLQLGLATGMVAVLIVGGIAAAWTAMIQGQLKREALLAESAANAAREKAEEARVLESEQRLRAEREEALAKSAMQEAESERIRSLNMLADMQTERGFHAGQDGQPAEAALWFANAALLTPHDHDRQQANHRRAETWGNQAMKPVALLQVADGKIARFSFDRNGALALTVSGDRLRLWDWRNEVVFPWTDSFNDVSDAAWSPDGNVVAIGRHSGVVQLVESFTGKELRRFNNVETADVLAWSPHGTHLVTAGRRVQVWNVTDDPVREADWPHPQPVYGVNFNQQGTRLVTACHDNLARVFAIGDATGTAPLFSPVEHAPLQNLPSAIPVFCDDDQRLVTFRESRNPTLWDAETGSPVETTWKLPSYPVTRSLSVSPDQRWIAAGGSQGCCLLSVHGKSVELKHPNHVGTAVFAPDGQSVFTICFDEIARYFAFSDLGSPSPAIPAPELLPQQATFACGSVTPDGKSYAIQTDDRVAVWERPPSSGLSYPIGWRGMLWLPRISHDGQLAAPGARYSFSSTWTAQTATLSVARVSDGQPAGPEVELDAPLLDSCVCSDNRSVAAACDTGSEGLLTIYDIASGQPLFDTFKLAARPRSIDARPGHAQLAVLCQDGTLQMFDTRTGIKQFETGHVRELNYDSITTEFSPDGATLLVLLNQLVYVHEPDTGELRFDPIRPTLGGGLCRSFAFSPDNRLLATASTGRNLVQVWDLFTGEKVGVELPHPGDFYGLWSVEFSPDGKRLLTGHKDGRIRIWDWRTGRLLGAPMQNPEEVFDARFTPDGHFVLAGVRHSPLHVWDVATGKLAVPLVADIVPAGASSDSVRISGDRAVVTSYNRFSVLDLSVLLPNPSDELSSLATSLELATNLKLQLGELTPLEVSEWNSRWEQYIASRQSPQEAAQALAQAFDQAGSHERRMIVARRAAQRNILDRVLALRPDAMELQLERILEFERAGDSTTASQLTRQLLTAVLPADAASLPPTNLTSFARAVVSQLPAPDFTPVSPETITAESACEFRQLPDGSILTTNLNTNDNSHDVYTMRFRQPISRLTALRLEAVPHSALPNGGSGWEGGNFHLTNVRAELQGADGAKRSIAFKSAISDTVRSIDPSTSLRDGPWGAIDGDDATRWDVWPQVADSHWLILPLDQPVDLAQNASLIVQLEFKDPMHSAARLGSFRLSVCGDATDSWQWQLRSLIEQQTLIGIDALAAAYLCTGETDRSLQLLESTADAIETPLRMLLRARAYQLASQSDAAREALSGLVKAMDTQSLPRDVQALCLDAVVEIEGRTPDQFYRLLEASGFGRELSRLSAEIAANPDELDRSLRRANYLSRLGRWHEATEDLERCVELEPSNRIWWAQLCTTRLLSGDREQYLRDCERMRKALANSLTAEFADSLCKANLLLPDSVDLSELPIQRLRQGIDDPEWARYREWFLACQTLISLRQGNPAEAIEWTRKLQSLTGKAGTMALVVRAIAEQQLGKSDEATESLRKSEALIPSELRTLGSENYSGPLPVAEEAVSADWLIPEILRREARTLIPDEPAD